MSAYSKDNRPAKAKHDTQGRPTSTKLWTTRTVCGHHYSNRVSEEHKKLSDSGEKDIGKYHAALATVFNTLTAEERQRCKDDAVEWNTQPLPDDIDEPGILVSLDTLPFSHF